MTAEVAARIFEPFFTTRPVGEGTGLGLPVVHGIIESLRGTITVESTTGVGSTFIVRFPLENDPVAATPQQQGTSI
jgi:signal transduction histidine kinase